LDWNTQLVIALRLVLAFAAGGVVGYERTYQQKPAGSRTHALVCLASALFMIVSIYGFTTFEGQKDPARLAAQVVTGMGFIGAGTIWREGSWVRGLTTATTLWVTSALGLAIGAGLYLPAGVAVALVYIGLQFYTLKKVLTGRDEWFDTMHAFERLEIGTLKMGLERIFATPIKFSSFNKLDHYILNFEYSSGQPDPFSLTLSIKEHTLTIVLLYIPEHLRGKGYARSVIEAVTNWAKEHNLKQINLTSKSSVRNLWVKSGFQPVGDNMYTLKL